MLGWNLGQEQAAMSVHADEESVVADFECLGVDWLWRRENTQFNLQVRSFIKANRREACVLKGRGTGRFGDSAIQGNDREYITYAPTQHAFKIKRSENAAMFFQMSGRRFQ